MRRWILALLVLAMVAPGPPAAALDIATDLGEVDHVWNARWRTPDGAIHQGVTGDGVIGLEFEGYNMLHPELRPCGDLDHHRGGVRLVTGPGVPTPAATPPVPANGALDGSPGHGNHIAGIFCGSGEMSNGTHTGVAHGGTLFSMAPCEGACNVSSWFTDSPPRIVTSSVGETNVIEKMRHNGMPAGADVLFTQSAGNSGGYGNQARTNLEAHDDPRLLLVAAANGTATSMASYSSRGARDDPSTWPDITAPGCIWAIAPPPGVDAQIASIYTYTGDRVIEDPDCPNVDPKTAALNHARGYAMLKGTSMASPFVAAVGALVFQVNPGLSATDTTYIITRTADPFLETEDQDLDGRISPTEFRDQHGFKAGYGLVNATAAVAAAHYKLLHPTATLDEAVACSTAGRVDGDVWLNPGGGHCPVWWNATSDETVRTTTTDASPASANASAPGDAPPNATSPSLREHREDPAETGEAPSRMVPFSSPILVGLLLAAVTLFIDRSRRRPD